MSRKIYVDLLVSVVIDTDLDSPMEMLDNLNVDVTSDDDSILMIEDAYKLDIDIKDVK